METSNNWFVIMKIDVKINFLKVLSGFHDFIIRIIHFLSRTNQ